MTVVTKPITENKQDKSLEKPLVVSVSDGSNVECGVEAGCERLNVDGGCPPDVSAHEDLWTWAAGAGGSARRRRVSATTTVCVFVATLVMLTGAIIGGVYIYRVFTHNQMSRFRGWCGVPFKKNSLRVISHQQPMTMEQSSHWPSNLSPNDGVFNEQFDLDLGTDAYEEIYVPDFGIGREGRFVHDMKLNLTAIVDLPSRRCFVFPLDWAEVVSPRNMFRTLRKMWRGFYEGNMIVVRQTLRVVRPPVSDMSSTGPYISQNCDGFTTYRLEKVTRIHSRRLKRDTASEKTVTPYEQTDSHFTVAEFAGKAIMEYTVIDE